MTDLELREISGVGASAHLIRVVLAVGSLVFLLSAIVLVLSPRSFAAWLGMTTVEEILWTLRLLGVAVFGLAGQMWLVRRAGDHPVLGSAAVMVLVSLAMSALVVTLPAAGWTPLRWAYLGIGLVFAIAYAGLLALSRRQA